MQQISFLNESLNHLCFHSYSFRKSTPLLCIPTDDCALHFFTVFISETKVNGKYSCKKMQVTRYFVFSWTVSLIIYDNLYIVEIYCNLEKGALLWNLFIFRWTVCNSTAVSHRSRTGLTCLFEFVYVCASWDISYDLVSPAFCLPPPHWSTDCARDYAQCG